MPEKECFNLFTLLVMMSELEQERCGGSRAQKDKV